VIGAIHQRLGPNKLRVSGILQPLMDAFKLLSKHSLSPTQVNNLTYQAIPVYSLMVSLVLWSRIPIGFLVFSNNHSLLFFYCVGSLMVPGILLSGWASNSKYSLVGGLRSISQSISYEACLRTLLVLLVLVGTSFSFRSFLRYGSILLFRVFPVWYISVLAETIRAPFDIGEAESELVSGFNTEFSGPAFAFFFLSEYGVILCSCFSITILFWG
jgi:NADH-quinone oxidoreductase subunit H